MSMTAKLWSINALSVETGMDRRTVADRLRHVRPAGEIAGKPAWRMADAMPALMEGGRRRNSRKPSTTAELMQMSAAPEPPPGFDWLKPLHPIDAVAGLALMRLVYRIPAAFVGLAVGAGVPCKVAFALWGAMAVGLTQKVAEVGCECGLEPWTSEDDPAFVAPDLFDKIDWPKLAEMQGETYDLAEWEAWSAERFGG